MRAGNTFSSGSILQQWGRNRGHALLIAVFIYSCIGVIADPYGLKLKCANTGTSYIASSAVVTLVTVVLTAVVTLVAVVMWSDLTF